MFNRKRTKSTIIKNGLKTLNQNFKPRQRVTIKYMIINILKKIKNNSAKFIYACPVEGISPGHF